MRLFYTWRGLDEWRAESCTVELGDEGMHARGVQIGPGHRLRYELATDAGLTTQTLFVRVHTADGEHGLQLVRDEHGEWTADGEPLPHVSGALDCDLALSPLTNHMPTVRLGDQPVDHVMAWVSVPDLAVLRSEQRYEPVAERRVRFVSLEDGFSVELELDERGFVTRYPGLAEQA
jgi:uncharacterized protein